VSVLKQINFFSNKFYCFYQDPLKNLVIGLPESDRRLSLRKKLLRTICYDYSERITGHLEANVDEDFEIP
jgi:hypothetical protein